MNRRALLLDIGNTRLKWGILDGERLVRTGDAGRAKLADSGFTALATRLPRRIDAALASNVAGQGFATRLSGFIGGHCGTELHFARSEKQALGVTNGYQRPRQLGADRWVAMIGARAEFKTALCIVDAGSAITIDGLDRNGRHLGGQVIPGLHLMARSLIKETNGINEFRVQPADPGPGMALFANNTKRGVQAGSLNAICGAIERAVKIMRAQGYRPKVVLTGGGAAPILKQLDGKALHRPNLVLQGLATILQSRE